ncbi:MAG: virulence factor [Rhodobacteraceae bacterium]|nr:virulence factor [Paracoccaceae bacterium]
MHEIIYLYWRDIPAQVIVGKGRNAAKVQLSERFEQAIDRCAMKSGAKDSDAYLAEWKKMRKSSLQGEPKKIAADLAEQLEQEFDSNKLRNLIANDGWSAAAPNS